MRSAIVIFCFVVLSLLTFYLSDLHGSDFQFSETGKATSAVATSHYSDNPLQRHPTTATNPNLSVCLSLSLLPLSPSLSPMDAPSRGGDVAVYVFDVNQPNLSTRFYSVLVSVSAFMSLSTVFHSINSPNNSPLSHSVFLVLFLPYWSLQLFIAL